MTSPAPKPSLAQRIWRDWLTGPRSLVMLPVLCAVVVCLPLFAHPGALLSLDTFRSHDWLESAKFDAFARISLFRWGQLPHWNPYLQGGMPQIAHPSDGSFSPLILPTLLFGEAIGLKLNVMLVLALGAAGVALLGRDRARLSPAGATFAGCAYALAGWQASRVSVGFYESTLFVSFPMLGWLLLTSGASEEAPRGRPIRLLLASLLLGTLSIQLQLGLPVLMLALALLMGLELLRKAEPWRAGLTRFVVMSFSGFLFALPKHLPMLNFMAREGFRTINEYPVDHDSWYGSIGLFVRSLLFCVPFPGVYSEEGFGQTAEFGYIGLGLPVLLLALWGLARGRKLDAAQRSFAALTLLFGWLSFGPNAPIDLFWPLWNLPVFHSMRGPVRYTSFPLYWGLCVLAGVGFDQLRRRLPAGRRPLVIASALLLAWPALQTMARQRTSFTHSAGNEAASPEFFHMLVEGDSFGQSRGGHERFNYGNLAKYINLKRGVGTLYVPEDLLTPVAARARIRYDIDHQHTTEMPDYLGEAWCRGISCGAELIEISANRMVVRLEDARAGQDLVLNQNWYPLWKAEGCLAFPIEGLIGCRLEEAGPQEVVFRYRPMLFHQGLGLSALTALGWGLYLRRRRREDAVPDGR